MAFDILLRAPGSGFDIELGPPSSAALTLLLDPPTDFEGSNSIVQSFTPQAGTNRGWLVFIFHADPNTGDRSSTTVSYDNQALFPGLVGSRQFTNNGSFPWDMVQVEVWAADETFIAARAGTANISAQNIGANAQLVIVELGNFDAVDANNGGAGTATSVTTTVAATAGNQDVGWTFSSSKYAHIAVAVLDQDGDTWMFDGLARNATGDATANGTQTELFDAAHTTATLRASVSYRAFEASSTQTVNLALVSETNTAYTLTVTPGAATIALALAAETDTAHAITVIQSTTVALSLAAEVDSAPTLTPAPGSRSVTLALASELDSALTITPTPGSVTTTLALAAEVDTAHAVTATFGATTVNLSLAAEVDSALTISPAAGARTVSLALASETDTALALAATVRTTLAVVSEVDSAPTPTVQATRSVTLSLASETDSALTLSVVAGSSTVALALASEADSALALTVTAGSSTIALDVAAEVDTAHHPTITTGQHVHIDTALETNTAYDMTIAAGSTTVALGLAAEVDTAWTVTPLSIYTVSLGLAAEVDTAPSISVSATRTVTLALASEADSALTVTPSAGSLTRSLALAAEVDTAPTITLVSMTTVGLALASEVDTAPVLSLTATATIGLATASETDSALALVGVPGSLTVLLPLVAEVDSAPAIDAIGVNIQRITLATALETNTAYALTIRTSSAPAPRRRVGIVGAWTLQPHETVVAMSPNVFAVAVLEPAVVTLATIAEPRATMVVQPAAAGEVVYRAPVQR